MTDAAALKERIREHYAAQARINPKSARARHPENVVPMIELARPKSSDRALDLACGWGFVVLEFASRTSAVTGIDLTPEMVDLAKQVASERGVTNVAYAVGDAEALEVDPGAFNIITCRFSFHHFPQPGKALEGMKRALAPGGRIVLYDFVASADPEKAALHNEIERLRDPCHVKVYTSDEYAALFRAAGLRETARVTTLWKRDFDRWMAQIGSDDALRAKVRKMMIDAEGHDRAGLGVRDWGDSLSFSHNCVAWRLEPAS